MYGTKSITESFWYDACEKNGKQSRLSLIQQSQIMRLYTQIVEGIHAYTFKSPFNVYFVYSFTILLYTLLQNVAWHLYASTMSKHWLGKIPKTSNKHIHQYIKRVSYFYEDVNVCPFLSNFFIHFNEWYINLLSWLAITITVNPSPNHGIPNSVHGSPESPKGLSH